MGTAKRIRYLGDVAIEIKREELVLISENMERCDKSYKIYKKLSQTAKAVQHMSSFKLQHFHSMFIRVNFKMPGIKKQ